jgi:hypothetical protein
MPCLTDQPDPGHEQVIALATYGAPVLGCVATASAQDLTVQCGADLAVSCEVLQTGAQVHFKTGDRVLVILPRAPGERGVVLGRLARYDPDTIGRHVDLNASESMTLRCGESSIDLRADGKVMIRGDDVLVRAKGTKRIRAGAVSIN